MADFKPFLDDFGFLPHEKGLEPVRANMDSVVTSRIVSHLKTKLDSPKKSEWDYFLLSLRGVIQLYGLLYA